MPMRGDSRGPSRHRLCSRWRDKSEVFRFQLIMSEDIGHRRLGFCGKGSIVFRIFVCALIEKQDPRKTRTRVADDWPGRELLTVQEDLKPEPILLKRSLRAYFRSGSPGCFALLRGRRSYRAHFGEGWDLQ